MRPYKPYVPRTIGELKDQLAYMMLASPTFRDRSGYFPQQNIETTFYALNEGLKNIRKKVGEERYQALVALSDRMRAHFEADPENKTDDTIAGRYLIHEMEDVLANRPRRQRPGHEVTEE